MQEQAKTKQTYLEEEACVASLADALRCFLEAKEGTGQEGKVEDLLRRIRAAHAEKLLASPEVIGDVVKALAIAEFPQPFMEPVIDRWVPYISKVFLDDPLMRTRLEVIWDSLTSEDRNA